MKNTKRYSAEDFKINQLEEKMQLIHANKFETIITLIGCLSTVVWTFMILILSNTNIGILPSIFQPLSICVPILLGTATTILLNKDNMKNYKKSFSCKNSKEKLEEYNRCEIEKETLKSINKIKNGVCNITKVNETHELIDYILKEQSKKIEVSVTKKVISKNFNVVRCRANKYGSLISHILIISMISTLCYNAPLILNMIQLSSKSTLFSLIMPFLISGIGVGSYIIKRNKDYKSIFNKLNNELGDNGIPEYNDYNEDFEIELENVLRETNLMLKERYYEYYKEMLGKSKKYKGKMNIKYEPINEDFEKQDEGKKIYVKKLY